MNKFFMNVLGTVVAAAIVANVAFMFQVNERLARLETRMDWLTINAKGIAKQNE